MVLTLDMLQVEIEQFDGVLSWRSLNENKSIILQKTADLSLEMYQKSLI